MRAEIRLYRRMSGLLRIAAISSQDLPSSYGRHLAEGARRRKTWGLPSIEDGKPMITWRATSLAPDGPAWH